MFLLTFSSTACISSQCSVVVKLVTPVAPNEPDVCPVTVEAGTPVVPYEPGVCPLTVESDVCPLIVDPGVCSLTVEAVAPVDTPVPVMPDDKLDNGVT